MFSNINRYREIISVLIKHGFGELVSQANLEKYVDLGKKIFIRKRDKEIIQFTVWERIRMVIEELGPVFVKFGQIMSTRPDFLPPELILELEKLQHSVPHFSFDEVKKIIESEFDKPLNEIFKEFNKEAVASGSIAQVHKAVLFDDKVVAVKVQRPGINKLIESDISIMLHLATLAESYIKDMELLNPISVIKEFEKTIKKEIDFKIEAGFIQRFSNNFKEDKSVYVPELYRNYSGKKVLTMEFIDGVKISDLYKNPSDKYDRVKISDIGTKLILKQIFEHGFFHADPHPGNILVLENNVVCYLDFGMMGFMYDKHQDLLGSIIVGFVNKDVKKITKTIVQLSLDKNVDNVDLLEYRVFEMIEQYAYLPLKDINASEVLNEMFSIVYSFRLKIPPSLYLLAKAMAVSEGIGRSLNPDFDMVAHAKPYAAKIIKDKLNPKNLLKDFYSSAIDIGSLLKELPSDIKDISEQIRQGKLKIELAYSDLNPLYKKYDQISNRIAFAIILASLVIGSSLIVLAQIPPTILGLPIIGLLGFAGAGIMGFWLLISILRHGKM